MKDLSIILPDEVIENYRKRVMLKSIMITKCGYYIKAKGHFIARIEAIKEYIVIYCLDGKGEANVGEKNYIIEKEDLLIILAYIAHLYGASTDEP